MAWEQEGYRFFNGGGTPLAAQDTAYSVAYGGTVLQLRVLINGSSNADANPSFELQFRRPSQGGEWATVPLQANQTSEVTLANLFTHGTPTSAVLTPPAGKTTSDFVAGQDLQTSVTGTAAGMGASSYTEMVWRVSHVSGRAFHTFDYEYRVTYNGSPLDTISVTPQVTVAGKRYILV